MNKSRGLDRPFWFSLVVGTAVFAVLAFLAGPRTPLSWVVIVASGPGSAAIGVGAWSVQDRRKAGKAHLEEWKS